MKSLYRHIWILFFIIGTLISCSDDKNKNDASIYQGTYLGSNLELTISGVETTGKILGINNKGELILQYIIPGESVLDIPLTQNGGWLEGSTSINNGTVYAKGLIKDKKLIMDLTINITSPIIGKWELQPLNINSEGVVISSPIYVNAQPAASVINFMDKEMTLGELDNALEEVLGKYAQVIESITFKEDGYLIITFANSAIGTLPAGLIQYYIKDDLIYIMPNLIKLFTLTTSVTESRSEMEVISEIFNLLTEGIPFVWNIDNNTLKIFTTKQMMSPYFIILKELLPLLPSDNEWVKIVDEYFPDIYKIFETVTKFDFGVSLKK